MAGCVSNLVRLTKNHLPAKKDNTTLKKRYQFTQKYMLDLFDHFLRKAYSLSLNEYAVLCEIHGLSHNVQFNGWCIASKEYLAETLDLTRDTVFRAIKKLVSVGLVEKNEDIKALRTTDTFNSVLTERRNFAFSVKTKIETLQVISGGEKSLVAQRLSDVPSENQTPTILKSDGGPSENQTQLIQGKITLREKVNKSTYLPKSAPESGKKNYLGSVWLTDDEYRRLCSVYGKLNTKMMVEELSTYLENFPRKKYKSHYRTMVVWFRRKKDFLPDKQFIEKEEGRLGYFGFERLYGKREDWVLKPTDNGTEENQAQIFGEAAASN